MGGLADLIGASFGPVPVSTDGTRIAAFAAATGDDPGDWDESVPPMFANAALFAVAPALLGDERVAPFTRSLIHSEQSYSWSRDLAVAEHLTVVGTVDGVRERGPLNLVTFVTEGTSPAGTWFTGTSVFLMSQEAAASSADDPEPDADDRPPMDATGARVALPPVGEPIDPLACGASRTDLAAYADASGDHNPIHLDHDAARAAGLSGVIVHGLLMGAWMARAVARYGDLASIRLRFRNPLRPAVPAAVTGTVADSTEIDLVLSARDERLVTGRAVVTP